MKYIELFFGLLLAISIFFFTAAAGSDLKAPFASEGMFLTGLLAAILILIFTARRWKSYKKIPKI